MTWDRIRYELRLLGVGAYIVPVLVVAIYLMFSLIVGHNTFASGQSAAFAHFQSARGLLGLLENGLPLAAGLIAALCVGPSPAMELHLSLPRSYRSTLLQRLGLGLAWSGIVTCLACAVTILAGYWIVQEDTLLGQLVWLTPVLWFVGAGAFLTVALRSRVASSTLLGLVWIVQYLFKPEFLKSQVLRTVYLFLSENVIPGGDAAHASYWLANRLVLLGMALALLALTGLLLGRNELLLGSES